MNHDDGRIESKQASERTSERKKEEAKNFNFLNKKSEKM